MRVFVAIEIPENIKEVFAQLTALKSHLQGVNIVQKENFHITLKFLGEVKESLITEINQALKEVANEFASFSLKITYPGVFPDIKNLRIIWIGTENTDTLKRLAKRIDEQMYLLGFQREEREFKSHITLARVKNTKNGNYFFEKIVRKFSEESPHLQFQVKDFVLMKSTLTPKGSIYSVLERFLFHKL